MSCNLASLNTVEALYVFNSLMAEHGYRVMCTSITLRNGKRRYTQNYVTFKGEGWIECMFEYSQSARNLRVEWYNQASRKSGKLLLSGLHAGHAGQWSDFRSIVREIFDPNPA